MNFNEFALVLLSRKCILLFCNNIIYNSSLAVLFWVCCAFCKAKADEIFHIIPNLALLKFDLYFFPQTTKNLLVFKFEKYQDSTLGRVLSHYDYLMLPS